MLGIKRILDKINRRHTVKRLINLLLVKLQLCLRSVKLLGQPYFLVVESTNQCNLSCPLCPTGQGVKGRAKGKMSFSSFKKIIDELGDYLYFLRLENWGEPLLNEAIFDMIFYANSKKIATSLNTNLSFLDAEDAKKLILSGLDYIKISLDGASEETYIKYRIGGNFHKVVENIKHLVIVRDNLKKKNPIIEIQFIMMKHNEHELEKIKILCKTLGVDSLFIEKLRPDMGEELFNSDLESFEKYRAWLPTDSKYSIFNYTEKKRKFKRKICNYLWTTMVINWDGSVFPCCSIYDYKYSFGNIFKEGFKKIWNGKYYSISRKIIGRKKVCKESTVCINCLKNGIIN